MELAIHFSGGLSYSRRFSLPGTPSRAWLLHGI
jgi:hypothetical protein